MAEPTQYSSNSNKSKQQPAKAEVERAPLKPIVVGKAVEQKESVGHKFLHSFAGDTLKSVSEHLIFDVVVPAAKSLISTLVREGVDRMLYGATGRPSAGRTYVSGGGTSYSGMYRPATQQAPATPQHQNERGKNIILDNRADADAVLLNLENILDQYNAVWVRDLYELVNITPAYTDEKLGWTDLKGARVVFISPTEYLLDLPKPTKID